MKFWLNASTDRLSVSLATVTELHLNRFNYYIEFGERLTSFGINFGFHVTRKL